MIVKKIPSLFPHNHASNIVELSNGDLLCVWFGGSCEGKPDISVQCSRLEKGSEDWSEPIVLSGDETRSEQNPILFEKEAGRIWLIYTAQIGIHQDTAVVRWRKSEDFGKTWGPIENLFEESGIFVRNTPIQMADGKIVFPAYYCLKSETGFLGEDYSVMKLSDDDGKTWRETKIHGSEGLVHLSIVPLEDKIIGFFRSRKADHIYMTASYDQGETWSVPVPTTLPNNNASIQCNKMLDGRLMIIFNDVNAEMSPPKENKPPWFDKEDLKAIDVKETSKPSAVWGVRRSPLVIAVSKDGGETWERVQTVIDKEGFEGEPEFSYPSIMQSKDGQIHVTYTHLRHYINHVEYNSKFE